MPRLTPSLFVKKPDRYKKFTNYIRDPAYKKVLPAELRDTVPNRDPGEKSVPCLQEMSMMLQCFNRHDFQQGMCTEELKAFYTCQEGVKLAAKKTADDAAKGIYHMSRGKMPGKFVNSILANYPQPKKPKS